MTELDRPLAPIAEPAQGFFRGRYRVVTRLGVVALLALALAMLVSRIDFEPNMRRLKAGMLSGARGGNYDALVADLAGRARLRGGNLRNVGSAGSGENIRRLQSAAASGSCELSFALAQDGSDFAAGGQPIKRLELLGRLPKSESVFFLGRDADKYTNLGMLKQAKIGLGPDGSGSARLGKQLFALDDLAPLDVTLSFQPIAEELSLAERGELDLALVVIDEDAPLLLSAVRERHLQIAGLRISISSRAAFRTCALVASVQVSSMLCACSRPKTSACFASTRWS